MNRVWIPSLTIVILALTSGLALGGRNINGAMVVHTSDSYDYSSGSVCTTPESDPGNCMDANTMASRATGQVIWLLAAFPDGADPCVNVIYFGIDYDDVHLDPGSAHRACGPAGTIEIPDDDWPYGGRGNSIGFGSPVCHDHLFPFYAFQVDGGVDGASYFCTSFNPAGGYAAFVDESDPPAMDQCYLFGCVRWGAPGANECPGESVIPGACCYQDGTCAIVTAGECLAAGGVYLGDNEPCIPDPCPNPGACCYADGRCEFVLPGDCRGTFEAGTCDPNPCPQPGACCQPHWCQIVMQDHCDGYFFPHVPCDPNPCLNPGACCFADGHCDYVAEPDCHGGVFVPGVPCNPDPCPPAGACCTPESCIITMEHWCSDTFYPNTPCDPNPCWPAGACCYPDGSCETLLQGLCHTGVFYPSVACDPNPCPQPVPGACCFPDGHCESMMDYECGTGDFLPEVPCDPNPCPQPGACCTVDWCAITMDDECSDTFHPHASCDPNPCWPSGACCYPDGRCEMLLQGYCETGVFYPDVACDPNPCPPPVFGACCFPDGHCEPMMGYQCGTGSFFADVACDPNPCPQPVPGACCYPDGHCEYVMDYECGTGDFLPEVACDPNPCRQPVSGACCFPDGQCEVVLDYECSTGAFYPGLACDPNPCSQPLGACCYPGGYCAIATAAECLAAGGNYLGDNVPCDPNPCSQPMFGACCYPDGHCEHVLQDQCGGVFYANYDCDPNPCPTDCGHPGIVATGSRKLEPNPDKPGPIAFSSGNGPVHRIQGTRDVCWSEPADLNDAKITSEIIADYGLVSEIANDFMLAISTTISKAIAYGGMYNWSGEPNITRFNLYFYEDGGCVPAVPFECYLGVEPTQNFIGYDGYGYPTYKIEYGVSVGVGGNELYWFGFQAANHTFPPQWGRQGTGGVVTNCDTMFKSAFFGFPYWTPASDLIGSPYDAAQEFECGGATPIIKTTWGAIKARYR